MRGAARSLLNRRAWSSRLLLSLSVHSQLLCPSTQSLPRSLVQLPRLSFPPSLLHSQERSVSRSVANRRRRWPLLRLLVPRDNSMPVVCSVGHGPRDLFLPSPDSCLLPGQVPTAAPPLRAISLYEESGLVERVGEEGRGSRPGPLR